jgi:UDP-glucuronate decarboxylase
LAWYAVPGKYLSARENLDCVMGSQRLFLALGAAGCRRIVSVGSCFEYDFSHGHLSEATPTRANSLYAAAKTSTFLMGEQIAKEYGVPFAWPRLFYLYGPNEDPRRLVPFIITSLLRGEQANVTSGKQVRDFLHVEDVAAALAEVATSDLIGPVNVGSGIPVTVRTVVETIAQVLGRKDLVRFGARPDNPTDPPLICANNLKLTLGTGWKPKYDLATGLAQAISWWRTALGTAPPIGS